MQSYITCQLHRNISQAKYKSRFGTVKITFVDTPKTSEVHLIRAVEDHHKFSKAAPHVLGCLCFASSSGSSWSSAHGHPKSLCQGDVAPIGQGSDDQTLCAAQELILVLKIHISDGDDAFVCVLIKVESSLLLPLKVCRRLDVHAALWKEWKNERLIMQLTGRKLGG